MNLTSSLRVFFFFKFSKNQNISPPPTLVEISPIHTNPFIHAVYLITKAHMPSTTHTVQANQLSILLLCTVYYKGLETVVTSGCMSSGLFTNKTLILISVEIYKNLIHVLITMNQG